MANIAPMNITEMHLMFAVDAILYQMTFGAAVMLTINVAAELMHEETFSATLLTMIVKSIVKSSTRTIFTMLFLFIDYYQYISI